MAQSRRERKLRERAWRGSRRLFGRCRVRRCGGWRAAGCGRQLLQPGEVEDVVILAADELDEIVARLPSGEIAGRFGHRVAEDEFALIDTAHCALGAAGRDELPHRPALTFVIGHGGEQSVAGVRSFPKWGFGNANVAEKLCFAVKGAATSSHRRAMKLPHECAFPKPQRLSDFGAGILGR